jgi:hypothetical protein
MIAATFFFWRCNSYKMTVSAFSALWQLKKWLLQPVLALQRLQNYCCNLFSSTVTVIFAVFLGNSLSITVKKRLQVVIAVILSSSSDGSSKLCVSHTGTCGQDPMLPPPFFFFINILQLSMYHCMTYIQ